MCCQGGNEQAEEDARRVGQYPSSARVESPQQLAGRLLTTVYMGTVNSSQETKDRAASLARQVAACLPLAAKPSLLCCMWNIYSQPQSVIVTRYAAIREAALQCDS